MLDVRRLALLRELDVRGSIAAVSRAVGISPSAISQQLTKLQAEVGITLLEQVGRNVQLTPAARQLAHRADQVVAILDDAEAELDARRGRAQGVVRLAAFSTYALSDLPAVLRHMQRTHPQVIIEFSQTEPTEAVDAVAGRRADIAVVDEYPRMPRRVDPGITRTHVLRDRITAYLRDPRPRSRSSPSSGGSSSPSAATPTSGPSACVVRRGSSPWCRSTPRTCASTTGWWPQASRRPSSPT